jgi:ATP-dependent RNA helicase SUPV3L1/SUV3
VERLVWRSVELDFSSARALLDSLSVGPPAERFTRVERADDFDALKALAQDAEVLAHANAPAGVELLWDVCRIPDFRKGLLGEHPRLVKELFLQLSRGNGRLRDDWLRRQVDPLDDLKGDLHTLTARLEAIRTWTYISHRPGWLGDADAWQQKTRAIEDALGDALHQRLVERFVHKSAARRRRAPVASGPFSQLAQFLDHGPGEDDFVQRVVEARGDELRVDALGLVSFEGATLGKLVVSEAMGGFPAQALTSAERPPPLRAIAWRFARGLGIVRRDEALLEQVRLLDADSHRKLDELGVRQGARFLLVAKAATAAALERRVLLTALFEERIRPAGLPTAAVVRLDVMRGLHLEAWGYERVGPVALRIDALETILASPNEQALRQLGIEAATGAWLLKELGGADSRRRARAPRR